MTATTSKPQTFAKRLETLSEFAWTAPRQEVADMRDVVAGRLIRDRAVGDANFYAFAVEYLSAAVDHVDDANDEAWEAARPKPLADGYYTIVLADGGHVTLRVSDDFRADAPDGSKVVAYLMGQDNESDYAGFAFVDPQGRPAVWKRFRDTHERQREALDVLLGGGDRSDLSLAYALESGRCARCGRRLTVPASIHRGFGPECYQRVGQ